jgi:hypothetical protein
MKGCENMVKAVIQYPFQIYQDGINHKKKVLYTPHILPVPFGSCFLRVVIEYRKSRIRNVTRGFVCTAFACKNQKRGDFLIWERPV